MGQPGLIAGDRIVEGSRTSKILFSDHARHNIELRNFNSDEITHAILSGAVGSVDLKSKNIVYNLGYTQVVAKIKAPNEVLILAVFSRDDFHDIFENGH